MQLGAPPFGGVKARNRTRIVAAAHAVVADGGVESLSMRSLARAAGVSVRTLYNLFGTKDAIVRALATDVLETLDTEIVEILAPSRAPARNPAIGKAVASAVGERDPLAEARAEVTALVDVVVAHSPPSLVLAILDDEHLVRELNAGWQSRDALQRSISRAIAVGELDGSLSAGVLAEQVRHSYVRHLRMWAAGIIDPEVFRAGVLYTLDLALASIAPEPTRRELVRHAHSLEPALTGARA